MWTTAAILDPFAEPFVDVNAGDPDCTSNICSLHSGDVDEDPFERHNLERLRRSIVMLRPGQPSGLDRERAVRLLEELQRLQRSDRRYRQTVEQLRAILDGLGGV